MVSGHARAKIRWVFARAPARPLRRAGAVFACAIALTCWLSTWLPAPLQAQDGPELKLHWQADAACPDLAWVESRLHDRLGRAPAQRSPSPLVVHASLARSGAGFALSLSSEKGGVLGSRELSGPRCDELAQAAVLVIALALEDQDSAAASTGGAVSAAGTNDRGSAGGDKPGPPQNVAPPPAPAPPLPSPATPKPAAMRFGVAASAMVDVGSLPTPAVGPQLALAYLGKRFRAELAGYWLPAHLSDRGPNGRVEVSLWALRPTGCGNLLGGALALELCAGLELGRMRGEGRDLNRSPPANWFYRSAWFSLRFSGSIRERWALFLEPALVLPLGRPRFVSKATDDSTAPHDLHTPSVASARVTLGLETRF
jgi:hypothetical protein